MVEYEIFGMYAEALILGWFDLHDRYVVTMSQFAGHSCATRLAVIGSKHQASTWPEKYRTRHDLLFELADITTATSHVYTKSAMFIRNRYLVNNADLLLAAYDGQPGGTAMTIGYAKANGVTVQIIRPVLPAA